MLIGILISFKDAFFINSKYDIITIEAMKEGYIMSGDCSLYYRIQGQGDKTIVFLHGNGESGEIFNEMAKHFSNCRLVFLDTRLHGKSSYSKQKLSYELFAQDTLRVLDSLGINICSIIGFSDGAITAMIAASLRPDIIQEIVLLGANYNPKGLIGGARLAMRFARFLWALLYPFSQKFRRKYKLYNLMITQPNLTHEFLQSINTKALVMVGERDLIKRKHTDTLAKLIGADKVIIKDANHFFVTHPRAIEEIKKILYV